MRGFVFICMLACLIVAGCGTGRQQESTELFVRPDEAVPDSTITIAEKVHGKAIERLPDGSYAVFGFIYRGEQCLAKIAVINGNGQTIWQKEFAGTGSHLYPADMELTSDGHLVIAGDSRQGEQVLHGWLCKTDLSGNLIWEKTEPLLGSIQKIARMEDGKVAVLHGTSDLNIGVVAKDGRLQQTISLDNQVYTGLKLFALKDGGLLAASKKLSEGQINHYPWVYRLDKNGSLLWEKEYKQFPDASVFGINENEKQELFFTGVMPDSIMKDGICWWKTDAKGNVLKDTAVWWDDDMPVLSKALGSGAGNLLFAGQMQNFKKPYRAFAGAFSPEGKLMWTRTLGDENIFQDVVDFVLKPNGQIVLLNHFPQAGASAGKDSTILRLIMLAPDGGASKQAGY